MGIFNCCKKSEEDWYQKKGVRADHWGAKVAGTKANGKADHISYRVVPKGEDSDSEYFFINYLNSNFIFQVSLWIVFDARIIVISDVCFKSN